ncbi:MAG: hypothetical protein AABX11_02120 [Nanoarchaeota archaeon]
MEGKEDFFKVYNNVSLEERKLTIVVLDGQPISWILAYQEIKNETKNGQKIFKILKELKII